MTNGAPRYKETWWWNRDVEEMVAKRKVCHKAWWNINRLKINILYMWPRRKYTQLCWQSKLHEFATDLQSESGRKNCFSVCKQMDEEGRDIIINVCCMKNEVGNGVSDADGMKGISFENDWDGDMDCPEVMGPDVLFQKNSLQQLFKNKNWKRSLFYWCSE